jgi:hypothetical protein
MCGDLAIVLGTLAEDPPMLLQRMFTSRGRLRQNSLITLPKLPMVRFAGCRNHGLGRWPGSTNAVDGGMATTKGRMSCCDGGTTPKASQCRRLEVRDTAGQGHVLTLD